MLFFSLGCWSKEGLMLNSLLAFCLFPLSCISLPFLLSYWRNGGCIEMKGFRLMRAVVKNKKRERHVEANHIVFGLFWMLLQVCREFQRGSCTRQPSECRYAHPPDSVTVETCDNQVTVCMDFIKGKCTRDSCKYFHPPPHLQAQIKAAQQRANSSAAQALVGFSPAPCQNQSVRANNACNTLIVVIKHLLWL